MKLLHFFLILISFLFTGYFSVAQERLIDSLKNELSEIDNDTAKIVVFNELAMLFYNNNPQKSLEYSTAAYKISSDNNYLKHISHTYGAMAAANWVLGNYAIGLDYLHKKLKIHETNNEYNKIAKTYKHIGIILNENNDDSLALNYLYNSLEIYEKSNNNVGIADVYSIIATICYKNNDILKAENYWEKASDMYEKENEMLKVAYNEHNLGLFHFEEGDYAKALKSFNIALQKCYENNRYLCVTTAMSSIGILYLETQEYELAEKYFLQIIDTAQKYGMSRVEMQAYNSLIAIDTIKKSYKSAFDKFVKYTELKDTIFSQEKNKKISELQIQYETEKIETENILLHKADKKNRYIVLTLGIALLSVILMLYFLRKAMRLKDIVNDSLLETNMEISLQKYEINEKNKELNKYFTIIEQAPVSIIITNTKGDIEYVNPFFAEQTGYTLDFVKGKNPKVLKTNKTPTAIFPKLWSAITRGEAWTGEFVNRKKSGEEYFERAIISPIKDENDKIVNFIAIKEDITERKELELKFFKEQEKLEIALTSTKDSINYAKKIQDAIFPEQKFLKQNFSDCFVFFQPLDVVSGDFYWVRKINEYIVFAVADSTGHGVPGAFVSILGISLLNEIFSKKEITSAGSLLDELRDGIKSSLKQNTINNKDGMDISLCVFNTKTKKLQFSGANNPMYIIKKSENRIPEINILLADRQPIGIYEDEKKFTNKEVQLEEGDMLYLLTDGYTDQFNGVTQEKFKVRRFKNLISSIAQKPLNEQNKIIGDTFFNWKKDNDQIDDIMILGLRI